MSKHLLMLTTVSGRASSVDVVSDLARRAMARVPEVRNFRVERQTEQEATVSFETDRSDWPGRLVPELKSSGLVLIYAELSDWLP